jgi:hypothetical protein
MLCKAATKTEGIVMDSKLPMIFADFNDNDPDKHVRLTSDATRQDLARLGLDFAEGDRYVLSDGELWVEGTLVFSREGVWAAEIDWDAIKEINT